MLYRSYIDVPEMHSGCIQHSYTQTNLSPSKLNSGISMCGKYLAKGLGSKAAWHVLDPDDVCA